MRIMIAVLMHALILVLPLPLLAQDDIYPKIVLSAGDDKAPHKYEPIKIITPKGLMKVLGVVKVVSKAIKVKAETYYFEWTYDDGKKEITLDSYATNPLYVFTRRVDAIEDFHWVSKRIWGSNVGRYHFKIYIFLEGKYKLKAQAQVEIKNDDLTRK